MYNFLQKIHRVLPLLVLLLITTVAFSQQAVFRDGVKQGSVKVKFAPTMTSSLHTMRVVQSGEELITGISSFDAVAEQTTATNMRRLFPYNEKNESKLKKHGLHLWFIVDVSDDANPEEVAAIYQALGEVELAEVTRQKVLEPYTITNHTPSASTNAANPFNDPYLPEQWHYQNDRTGVFSGSDANVFEAWATVTGSSDIIISVHDQGADVLHEDLAANMWVNELELNGTPGVDDDNNGYIDDIHGFNFDKGNGAIDAESHGTHVSGTIAAVNNNGIGVAGVAGGDGTNAGAKIMSLQVMGGGSIENSYVYAANNGAVISQNSWGYSSAGYYDQSILDAIDYFIAEAGNYPGSPMKGGIVIFASGNSSTDQEMYPGYYESTLAVSSTGPSGKKVGYSNYGSWVDISAPGGDVSLAAENGVLSLAPGNSYAWMQGTSMACPHVSGIAALVIASHDGEITADELRAKLLTGVSDVYANNPDYLGGLGTGSIDAAKAISNDQGAAPDQITDLMITGVAQEFATLSWTVPNDLDDGIPVAFSIYYSTEAIDDSNYMQANKKEVANDLAESAVVNQEVNNLFGLTDYFFVVTASDRWGNESVLSNEVTATTNAGPTLRIDDNSLAITMDYDATVGEVSHPITLFNDADGLLRWNHFMRHKSTSLAWNSAGISYPVVTTHKSKFDASIISQAVEQISPIRGEEVAVTAFTQVEKSYTQSPALVIGENDTTFTNSAATRFFVDEEEGFNLTQVQMYTNHDPATGPMIVEIYKGDNLAKENLVYAQEQLGWNHSITWSYVTLNEQLHFEEGDTFWIVFHVPSGNLYPLGVGWESTDDGSNNSLMSIDMGATWAALSTMMGDDNYAWSMVAVSQNAYLGEYLSMEPANGEVAGLENGATSLSADASTLINGTYQSNVVITSNDGNNQEVRLPVTLNVTGHVHNISVPTILDFGSTFEGTETTVEFVIANNGYGHYNSLASWSGGWTISDPQFELAQWPLGAPSKVNAKEEYTMGIVFKPTTVGPVNGTLTITDGVTDYTIALFGVGTETSEMTISPLSQTIAGLTIGDPVSGSVTVENTGGFPLEYFVPGYDEKGISDNWPTEYHKYGYNIVSSDVSETSPIAYDFIDISTTGVEITDIVKDRHTWAAIDMGFDFPYYTDAFDTLYVAWAGFTAFSDSVRAGNTPTTSNNDGTPRGYISPWGSFIDYSQGAQVHYQIETDRVIVQWTNAWDQGWTYSTFQMALFPNGNIRFYYPNFNIQENYATVMINSYDRDDAIAVTSFNYKNRDLGYPLEWQSNFALGFDYPGPDIITNVTNASGILMPGEVATIDIDMITDQLVEGTTNRYLSIIGNDPANFQQSALFALDIVAGGTPMPVVSIDTIKFGEVFQNGIASAPFTIKNNGSANVDVTNMAWVNGLFAFTGSAPNSIASGQYDRYSVEMPTATLAPALEDWLAIDYANGAQDTIYVSGAVVDAPAITVDLTLLQETLAYGDTLMSDLTIENTGLADLEAVVLGKHWLTYDETIAPASIQTANDSYVYEMHNDGTNYQWLDIRETGTKLPELAWDDAWFTKDSYWRTIDLPFPVEFYGEMFDFIRIGENGVLTFEDMSLLAENGMVLPRESMPTDENYEGGFIFPYWTFSTIGAPHIPENEQGIFYQFYTDKIVISWEALVNWFGGMGDPISSQVILYKNGTMKFQYKVLTSDFSAGDLTSNFTTIGIQNSDHSDYTIISENNGVSHGGGLAYILKPAEKHVITPGTTLSGDIKLDARNIYGGVYNADLSIQTNVPGSENLVKPVELTVTGAPVYSLQDVDSIDFGTMVVNLDQYGNVVFPFPGKVVTISNTGAAALEITEVKRKTEMLWPDVAQTTLQFDVVCPPNDPWCWGGWTDIENLWSPWAFPLPVYSVIPNESLEINAVFKATAPGVIRDTILVTTNVGEKMLIIKANAILPPFANIDVAAIDEVMNEMTETANHSIAFDNLDGASDLTYQVSIDYGRATTTSSRTNEAIATESTSGNLISIKASGIDTGVATSGTYNRIIQHGSETVPTTLIGTGGESAFSIATVYNTGAAGFKISHVESWFRIEGVLDATITVEIRAGGTTIANASTIATGSITMNETSSDDNGMWRAIALDAPAQLYEDEDFYVIITYPFGIEFPQGTVQNYETAPGRYLYFNEGSWLDIQEAGFPEAQWLMYAGEETPGASDWVTITSAAAGALAAGEVSTIDLLINGAASQRGDQIATIVFESDDSKNPMFKVPVSLHMNEAPTYSGVESGYIIAETDTLKVVANITDVEGHTFTVTPTETYVGLTYMLTGNDFAVNYMPVYGDEGSYEFTFDIVDEHNAGSVLTLTVEVAKTNQAPAFNDPSMVFQYATLDSYNEYSFADYFTDPDGDAMIYAIASGDDLVAKAFEAGDKFVIKTNAIGTSFVTITATDIYGATTSQQVSVDVAYVLGVEGSFKKQVSVYPVPTADYLNVLIGDTQSTDIRLINTSGQVIQTMKLNSIQSVVKLNTSNLPKGIYIVELVGPQGVFTKRIIKE